MAKFFNDSSEYFSLDEKGKIDFIANICRKVLLYTFENNISFEEVLQELYNLELQATNNEHYEMSEIFKLTIQSIKELQNEIENGTDNLYD